MGGTNKGIPFLILASFSRFVSNTLIIDCKCWQRVDCLFFCLLVCLFNGYERFLRVLWFSMFQNNDILLFNFNIMWYNKAVTKQNKRLLV